MQDLNTTSCISSIAVNGIHFETKVQNNSLVPKTERKEEAEPEAEAYARDVL